jgi:hypothetical protein
MHAACQSMQLAAGYMLSVSPLRLMLGVVTPSSISLSDRLTVTVSDPPGPVTRNSLRVTGRLGTRNRIM